MIYMFNLADYEPVEVRLEKFIKDYPAFRIATELEVVEASRYIVKAYLFKDASDGVAWATGYAEEIVGASPVNRTSALENGETSAIGRAISNSVLCLEAPVGARPSRSEMEKVERYKAEPRMSATKPKIYSDAEVKQAEDLMTDLPNITDLDKLRELFTKHAGVLDLPLNGTTLKDLFHTRAQELKND
jgi:hypothetical protein